MAGEFSYKTKITLAKRANEKCTICQKSTSKPHTHDHSSFINLGEGAHIRGLKQGPHSRYDASMNDEERADITNGIWVCLSCHKEIDSNSDKYTVEYLSELKRVHENKVSLGEFDINWKEYIQLQNRVSDLETIILEREKNQTIESSLHDIELNKLRIELQNTIKEKADLEQAIVELKTTLSGFELENPSNEVKVIVEAIKSGNLEEARNRLNEDSLLNEEVQLARKRLLKANLLEIDKQYKEAEANYKHAYELTKNSDFFENYISFLLKSGKPSLVIEIGEEALQLQKDKNDLIWLHEALGQTYSNLTNNKKALEHFVNAKSLIEESIDTSPERFKLKRAKIYNAIGVAFKNIGQYDEALLSFQDSLNFFFQMSIRDGVTHTKDLGALFINIARLYLENNNPKEALLYYSKAEMAYEEEAFEPLTLAILHLNKVDAYTHHKISDFVSAKAEVDLAKRILVKQFSIRQLVYLEYYIGALIKSGDILIAYQKVEAARKEYEEAIKLSEEFKSNYGIFYPDTMITAYSNYGIFLNALGLTTESTELIDKAINLLLSLDDSEHSKHLSLAKLYLLKSEQATERKKYLELANRHIQQCNNERTLSRAWKIRIEQALRETAE